MPWFSSADVSQIIDNQIRISNRLDAHMTTLQTAIATLTTNVQALTAAVTAAQASQFSTADVANVNAINQQVTTLAASLAPAPTPTPTPTPTPAPTPTPVS